MPDLDTLQPEALKAIILAQQLQILSFDNEIEHLKLLVAKLRRTQYGRRNYLFADSDAGGERAAAIYSLVASAKLNGMDPEAYLRHVLERIADHPIKHIAEHSCVLTYDFSLF